MSRYLVGTNLPSELTKSIPDARVAAFLINAGKESVFASVITIGEIAKGIANRPQGKRRDELRAWVDQVMRPWLGIPVKLNAHSEWKPNGIPG